MLICSMRYAINLIGIGWRTFGLGNAALEFTSSLRATDGALRGY